MQSVFSPYVGEFRPSGSLFDDVLAWFRQHDRLDLAEHTRRVRTIAVELAGHLGLSESEAGAAALLHDIARVMPTDQMVSIARVCGLEVYAEETAYPDLLHQRLAAEVARQVFCITQPEVLEAIGCHTTLRAGCSELDMLLLLADKLSWDRATYAPFAAEMENRLAQGCVAAVAVFLEWMWGQRSALKYVHPWLKQAFAEVCSRSWDEAH